ncbi:MAG: glycosyltransferase family 39 protein [Chloroflexi bacterium]|nr:glycosyltransferase family 39 protein [Chloroflexota bacterium]
MLVLVCLVPVLFFSLFWSTPFERDEGVYATVAQGLLDGRIPYRDLFDNKPPLVYDWYAFSFLLFGETVSAPRIVAAVLLSFTTLAVYAQARMLLTRALAYMAAGIFAVSTGLPFVALHANTEAYMLLPLVTSLLAFTQGIRSGRVIWFFLAGFLAALAMLTKQVAVWNLAALVLVGSWWRWRNPDRSWRVIGPALSTLAGAALALSLGALPFIVSGALSDFIYANVLYNYRYVGILSTAQRLFILKRTLLFLAFFMALAGPLIIGALIGFVTALRPRRSWPWYAFLAWTVASGLGVAMGARFYPHYFLQLLPAMAILSTVAIQRLMEGRRPTMLRSGLLLLTGLTVVVFLVTNALLYLSPDATEKRFSESAYYQKQWEKQSRALAAYVADRTPPDQEIFNYGREAQLYFYADRLPAARYFYDWAYVYDESTLPQTIEQLRRDPPLYIVDSVRPPLFQDADRHAAFDAFLEERYEYVGRVEFADVYRLSGNPR